MQNKTFALLIFLFLYCTVGQSKNNILDYARQYTISEGLAHNGVTCMLEDSKGYIWIGTYAGLNHYDGYEFTTIKNTIDKEIFVSNRIRSLAEDHKGNIWIGTDNGLTIYDYSQEKFKAIYSNKFIDKDKSGPIVRDILFCDDVGICITEDAGVLIFDENNVLISKYIPDVSIVPGNLKFFNAFRVNPSIILIASQKGIIEFDLKTREFKNVLKGNIFNCNSISRVNDSLLVVTQNYTVSLIKYEASEMEHEYYFYGQIELGQTFNSAFVDNDELWLGTLQNGFVKITNLDDVISGRPIQKEEYSSTSGRDRASCVLVARSGICWGATFNKGIYRFEKNDSPFEFFTSSPEDKYGLSSNHIMHIIKYEDSRFFVSANRGGFGLFNVTTKQYEELPFSYSKNEILRTGFLYVDTHKNFWLKGGDGEGLIRIDYKTRKRDLIISDSVPIFNTDALKTMSEDRNGNMWVGGVGGLYRIVMDNNKVKEVQTLKTLSHFKNKSELMVRSIYVDPAYDFVWVSTDKYGLFRITLEPGNSINDLIVEQYKYDKGIEYSLPTNFATTMIRLPNNDFWVGTENAGICKVIDSDKTPKFIPFTEKHGLSNNVVKGVVYDNEHYLWISTNIGLNRLDTRTNKFRRFSKEDGLPFEDFWYSSAKAKNGNLIFSGLDGLVMFNPNDLPTSETLP
ncbi:hypothetical protein OAO55_03505, partial [Bacteroidales bacterium]|nr:hypothetical protein [Bacteroidales bacterium]